jgi:hypothetical protein
VVHHFGRAGPEWAGFAEFAGRGGILRLSNISRSIFSGAVLCELQPAIPHGAISRTNSTHCQRIDNLVLRRTE